jgi:hypothetical protein
MRAMVLALTAVALTPAGANGQVDSVTIYVSPSVRDGFVDTSNNVLESVPYIREALTKDLQRATALRLVNQESVATVGLYVSRRTSLYSSGYAGSVTPRGSASSGRVYGTRGGSWLIRDARSRIESRLV